MTQKTNAARLLDEMGIRYELREYEVDPNDLASAAGERKIQLVAVKELQAITGYIRGGVTALGGKRDFPVYVDETLELFDVISISAGTRGLQILMAPSDYLRATKGTIAAIAQPKAGWQGRE